MEIRHDPITKRAVIIAEGRAERPNDFVMPTPTEDFSKDGCPFCVGNEDKTPYELEAFREEGTSPNQPGWSVRVFSNMYPAVTPDLPPATGGDRLLSSIGAFGSHEVIVDVADHLASISEFSIEQYTDVLRMYRRRLLVAARDERLAYGLIFKNVGPGAGASMVHTHSQLFAMPEIPMTVAEEIEGAAKYQVRTGCCIWCDLIDRARDDGRVVIETDHFIAFCPYAPRFPLETHVLPTFHVRQFEETAEDLLPELSEVMVYLIRKIETTLDLRAYNYLIHNAPFDSLEARQYHWHIEVMPRTTSVAGFEWGTGYYINPIPPELAAQRLRAVE
ncbi:MAG: DUF4921 family protein [Planctomycetia bacterium]|jgi:UDPglucose--hexose-1-phosphate uridylyltransferase